MNPDSLHIELGLNCFSGLFFLCWSVRLILLLKLSVLSILFIWAVCAACWSLTVCNYVARLANAAFAVCGQTSIGKGPVKGPWGGLVLVPMEVLPMVPREFGQEAQKVQNSACQSWSIQDSPGQPGTVQDSPKQSTISSGEFRIVQESSEQNKKRG